MNTNSIEWGIFNDEGCIEAQFYSEASAQIGLASYYLEGERGLSIAVICPEHEGQMADGCEECDAEECQHEAIDDGRCVECDEEV
jgi:hypothetical protein